MIQQLVAAGGDADTKNGAVAGALLGCRHGFSQLPQEWITQMPHVSWLKAQVQKVLFMLGLRA
jgi:ADP-ribosylglycohydrolase